MSELEQTLAFLFKRKREKMSRRDFVFSASMDLHWFSPKEAEKLLTVGIRSGLLSMRKGYVKPTFDYKKLVVPIDFTPTKNVLTHVEPEKNLFLSLVEEIGRHTEITHKELISRINKKQREMNIDIEVAALLVAGEVGVDVTLFLGRVGERVVERASGGLV